MVGEAELKEQLLKLDEEIQKEVMKADRERAKIEVLEAKLGSGAGSSMTEMRLKFAMEHRKQLATGIEQLRSQQKMVRAALYGKWTTL